MTNATNVSIPMIQLQGYANEELSRLTFDLTNANGTISNQPGFMTGAIFDTNSFSCTNNAFRCFDLALASGVNQVTLHATDLAGNLTNRTFIFNVNYSNKPAPVIQLYWPQDGAQISGGSFTWRGVVDDPTAALSAQITDSNGGTIVVAGVVERNGNFWVDNIPLAAGTSSVMLTATDINSNVTTTNITVAQSSVAITIAPITDDLYQPTVTVTGTINAANYTVWVNGVAASQSGSPPLISWTAHNVPMNGAGSAVAQARAIPNTQQDNWGNGTGSGGGGTNSSLSNTGNPPAPDAQDAEIGQDRPPCLYCAYFYVTWMGDWLHYSSNTLSQRDIDTRTMQWWHLTGGSSQDAVCSTPYQTNGSAGNSLNALYQHQWDTNLNGIILRGSNTNACGTIPNMVPVWDPEGVPSFVEATTFPGMLGMSDFREDAFRYSAII